MYDLSASRDDPELIPFICLDILGGVVVASVPLGGVVVASVPLGGVVVASVPLGGVVVASVRLGCGVDLRSDHLTLPTSR